MSAGQLVYVAFKGSGNSINFTPATGTEWFVFSIYGATTDGSGKYAGANINDISGAFSVPLLRIGGGGYNTGNWTGKVYFDDNGELTLYDGDSSNSSEFWATLIQVL